MGVIKVSFKQRYYNIDIKCCSRNQKQLIRQKKNYYEKTGKKFEFHCCFCYKLKTLNFIEPVDYKIENTKFTCKDCFNNGKSSVVESHKFQLFSTIKPPIEEEKIHKKQLPHSSFEDDYVIVNEDSDSEKTETNSNEDLKLFEIGEEFMNDRQIERYQNEIEALKVEVESLKSQINRDDEDIEFYRNESCHSWNLRAKLVTEIIDLADELAVNEIKKGKRYRRQSI